MFIVFVSLRTYAFDEYNTIFWKMLWNNDVQILATKPIYSRWMVYDKLLTGWKIASKTFVMDAGSADESLIGPKKTPCPCPKTFKMIELWQ